jgi:hypothetical protein
MGGPQVHAQAYDKVTAQTRLNSQTVAGLPTLRTNVAGMDLGSEEHWVCAPALEGAGREIARFGEPRRNCCG